MQDKNELPSDRPQGIGGNRSFSAESRDVLDPLQNRRFKLCEPYQIGQVRLKNRIVKAPFCTVMASREGFVTDALISFYETVAKGGVGLSIIEGTVVDDPLGFSGRPRLAVCDDKYIPGLQRLAAAIQQNDCPAILQLQHAGPAYSPGIYKSEKIVSQEKPETGGGIHPDCRRNPDAGKGTAARSYDS